MIARDTATERQIQAAMPGVSTWLAANAGSGKTRVLTDRVARLLLGGVPPEKVLCLTYTKAAASEMQNRLFKRLGEWAMMPDVQLSEQLAILGEDTRSTEASLDQARTLFARAIETPGGLKIQTIHSFCSALLRRFPLEAGVSPQFAEMEDRAAALMREEIVDQMASGSEAWRVAGLASYLSDPDFNAITAQIVGHREAFDPPRGRDALEALFDLPPGFTRADLLDHVFLGDEAPLLRQFVTVLQTGTSADQKTAAKLMRLGAPLGLADLEVLESVFLTGAKTQSPFTAKIGRLPTKKLREAHGDLMARIEPLMQRVEDARSRRMALAAVDKTAALHDFAQGFLPLYAKRKELSGALDFDDLIQKARDLLSDSAVAEWVLYRLDGGIDHILVDEAQDTSPAQWDVVDRLAREFTAGEGARGEIERTIFVVGDKKQSIYSFQGADPDGFDRMQAEFGARIRAVGAQLQDLTLEHSFRSSSAILQAVDQVFSDRDGGGFHLGGRHVAFKSDLPGRVDLWPHIPPVEAEPDGPWTDPVDRLGTQHHTVRLAEDIADQIRQMMATETLDDGKGGRRPVRPGDVMILVQRRSDLFAEIIRACKSANLPIAGADRLKVGAELAVRDLAALLRFLDTPEDDLSLAAALKSPLFGWEEQALFDLAHRREVKFLWQALRDRAEEFPETMAILTDLRNQSDFLRPYDLIERILVRHNGRGRLLARLGSEAEDGINALLSQALGYERSEIPSLTGFLIWMDTDELEIKRQMSASGDLIRVMTVHGSKGLEAPIVILPDTGLRQPRAETGIVTVDGCPIWTTPADQRPPALAEAQASDAAKREEENQRLLYVAMTRAEQWLIVAAAGKLDEKNGQSWYQQIEAALGQLGAAQTAMPGGDGLRFSHGAWAGEVTETETPQQAEHVDLPAIFQITAPRPQDKPGRLSPSDLGGAKALPGPDGLDEEAATQRGTAIHLLLEMLPQTDPAHWADRADQLLPNLAPSDRAEMLAEACVVLNKPELSALFSEDSLAEVEITGQLNGQTVLGQIDRLIITSDTVLAVDFKSNATVPGTVDQTPEGLLRQMGAYAALLSNIYPGHRIETAILWTRTARLMSLPHDLVRSALARSGLLDLSAEAP